MDDGPDKATAHGSTSLRHSRETVGQSLFESKQVDALAGGRHVLSGQRQCAADNAALSDGIARALRVGISGGEIVITDGTVTGAGVVLAQRLEQRIGADRICISGTVRESVADRLPQAHSALATFLTAKNRIAEALATGRRAIEVDPNYPDAYVQLAGTLAHAGTHAEALETMGNAMQLNPRYSAVYLWIQGRALFMLGRNAQAVTMLQEAVTRNPGFDQRHLVLAATCATMEWQEDAKWEAEEILALRPSFTILVEAREKPLVRERDRNLYTDGLREAGLPE